MLQRAARPLHAPLNVGLASRAGRSPTHLGTGSPQRVSSFRNVLNSTWRRCLPEVHSFMAISMTALGFSQASVEGCDFAARQAGQPASASQGRIVALKAPPGLFPQPGFQHLLKPLRRPVRFVGLTFCFALSWPLRLKARKASVILFNSLHSSI